MSTTRLRGCPVEAPAASPDAGRLHANSISSSKQARHNGRPGLLARTGRPPGGRRKLAVPTHLGRVSLHGKYIRDATAWYSFAPGNDAPPVSGRCRDALRKIGE